MSARAPPKVPAAVKPVFDDIVSITDLFCQQRARFSPWLSWP